MSDARSLRRLQTMDIPVWRLRRQRSAVPDRAEEAARQPAAVPRIRLEAGTGAWLLVVDDGERGRHQALLADVRALLGQDRCRFGSWSDSPESGVAVDEWPAHGIRHAIVFDDGVELPPGCTRAGRLDRLAESGDARRALWQALKPVLEA